MNPSRPLIAIDWGTSSLRGARLGASGQVLEARELARGILTVPPGQFEAVFHELFGDWLQSPDALCLISGMAGSRQGWQEAPYCPCPAGFVELVQHLLWLQPGRIALVPGLSCLAEDALHTPDVMRGEEVQIFGALQLAGVDSARLVLPGTHSKWVQVQGGRVTRFQTFMTGEVFALMCQHSILGKTLDLSSGFDAGVFLQGIEQSQLPASVLHRLFAVRTFGLFERLSAAQLPSYLSGLLIGEELRAQAHASIPHGAGPVLVIGSQAMTMRYTLALQHLNISSQSWGQRPHGRACSRWPLLADMPLSHQGELAGPSQSSITTDPLHPTHAGHATHRLAQAMAQLPLIAILRGLTPAQAPAIGQALVDSGFAIIEVPLNSPEPLQSIKALTGLFPQTLIGAGTVLNVQQVNEVHAAGGRLVVAPNFNSAVVARALALGMVVLPGVATPTEAFAAIDAGAHGLKLFPAEMISPATVKALRAVLPKNVALMPVGGITPDNMAAYLSAGATGFGLGSALYAPGRSAAQVQETAQAFVRAWASPSGL